jgi:hypothetical protein
MPGRFLPGIFYFSIGMPPKSPGQPGPLQNHDFKIDLWVKEVVKTAGAYGRKSSSCYDFISG